MIPGLAPVDQVAVAALIHHGSPYVADYVAAARIHPPKPDLVPGVVVLPSGTAPEPIPARPQATWSRVLRRQS